MTLLLLLCTAVSGESPPQTLVEGAFLPVECPAYATATRSGSGEWGVVCGRDKTGAAWGKWKDDTEADGWGKLYIHSNAALPDRQQMFAAGYLEGTLTRKRIRHHYLNFLTYRFPSGGQISAELKGWTAAHANWLQQTVARKANSSDTDAWYWRQADLLLTQLDGLAAGYNQHSPITERIPSLHFLIMNMDGDLDDLLAIVSNSSHPTVSTLSKDEALEDMIFSGRCSAFIKVLAENSDVLMGHSTWCSYAEMVRLYKVYHLPLTSAHTTSTVLSFSSYPGVLSSLDDFYLLNSGLVVMETSNDVFDKQQLSAPPQGVLMTWMRAMLANRCAGNSSGWISVYRTHTSNTYNNQWMLLDLNLFVPMQPLPRNFLWVYEDMPGTWHAEDVTHVLAQQQYWASYNRPYFADIFNMSGHAQMQQKYGDRFSHSHSVRANIFRRENTSVVDLPSLKRLMQLNLWDQEDPFSSGDAGQAVAARYDLSNSKPKLFGAIDAKVTSFSSAQQLICWAINGPTHQDQPPFRWSDTPITQHIGHQGQPDTYDFPWVHMHIPGQHVVLPPWIK